LAVVGGRRLAAVGGVPIASLYKAFFAGLFYYTFRALFRRLAWKAANYRQTTTAKRRQDDLEDLLPGPVRE
jgi:hypothetical protein